MQYSPKLKRVMQEFKDILSREDIAGVIVLHEPGACEYLLKLDPTYSAIKVKGEHITISAKLEDHNYSKVSLNKKMSDTANLAYMLSKQTCDTAEAMLHVLNGIKSKFEVNVVDRGNSSHIVQNN